MFISKSNLYSKLLLTFSCAVISFGCAVAAKENASIDNQKTASTPVNANKTIVSQIANSPSTTVREFYKALRERRFKDAMITTNLRPAFEALTAEDLKELAPDFESLAEQSQKSIDLNGEIVSKNSATVTLKTFDSETKKTELTELKLRLENEKWVLLVGDSATEEAVKAQGKNYFFNLRLDVHHEETNKMLGNIIKAQFVHASQSNGLYADFATLVKEQLLTPDILNGNLTGYKYDLKLSDNAKQYTVNVLPTQYGKTGKLSFLLESIAGKQPIVTNADNKGLPVNKNSK